MQTVARRMMLAVVLVLGAPAAEAAKHGGRGASGGLQQVVAKVKAFFVGETLAKRKIRPSRTVVDGSRNGYGVIKLKRRFGISYTVKTRARSYSSADDAAAPLGLRTATRGRTRTTVIPLGSFTLTTGKDEGLSETLAADPRGVGDQVTVSSSKGIDLFGKLGHLLGRTRTRASSAMNDGQQEPTFCSKTTVCTAIRGDSPNGKVITRETIKTWTPPVIEPLTGVQLAPAVRQLTTTRDVTTLVPPR